MKLTNEFEPIRNWAEVKGIYQKGDIKTQYVKLQEEAGELAKAIINNDKEEIIDAIGDCVVVLTSIAYFNNVSIEECVNSAYNVISKRKGKMLNGSFIKNK
jgi:NTP pyrophosphatase (non-canonical NTP hydrolase)